MAALPDPQENAPDFGALGNPVPLSKLELCREPLAAHEMARIVTQAMELLQGCYVHLPLKQGVHAANPIERLRVLRTRVLSDKTVDALEEREFHDEMIAIFAALRDLHTTYVLPQPYRQRVAFVPFMIEECCDEAERSTFVLAKVHDSVEHATFVPGVTITHWNGMPIHRAVQLNAERAGGANRFAGRARGISSLTFRWLGSSAEPDEHWVTISYLTERGREEVTFPWWVALRPEQGPTGDDEPSIVTNGLDEEGEWIRQIKKELFGRGALPKGVHRSKLLPDVFRWSELEGGEFGYVRIFTFNVGNEAMFRAEAADILQRLPKGGVVIDVRGNGGGNILAAEHLLQLLAPGEVQPQGFAFRVTRMTEQIVTHPKFLAGNAQRKEVLRQSVDAGRYTNEMFTWPFPLDEDESRYNDWGRIYPGPAVLIVDGLCYSATDIFAAGFQDNGIGDVVGTAGRTGAGGANVWDYETMSRYLGEGDTPGLAEMPGEASFSVAVRRATRVGPRAGIPLEHLGVEPTVPHQLTRRDVFKRNADLLDTAVKQLRAAAA